MNRVEGELMVKSFPVIKTERLILREVTKVDASDMLKYLSDKDVVTPMGLSPFQTEKDVWDEINWYKSIYDEGAGIRWGITLKGSGKVIGSCGYLNMLPKHYRAEVGYELSKNHWGKGIASEALKAVVKYGFDHFELERIEALIEPANLPSQKLVEKQDFEKEGLLRHYEFACGEFDDLYMYSIIKEDFNII